LFGVGFKEQYPLKTILIIHIMCIFSLVGCSKEVTTDDAQIESYEDLIKQVATVKNKCEKQLLTKISHTDCLSQLVQLKQNTAELILTGKASKINYSKVIASVDSAQVELGIIEQEILRQQDRSVE